MRARVAMPLTERCACITSPVQRFHSCAFWRYGHGHRQSLSGGEPARPRVGRGSLDIHPALRGKPDPFDPGRRIETPTTAPSIAINAQRFPAMIIAASGMATGGRVLHHLSQRLPDPRHTVILVGFQTEGTRGRSLLDGARSVKLRGRYVPVRAEVVHVPALSVHADQTALLDGLRTAPQPPDMTCVVHGETPIAASFRTTIEATLGWTVAVPRDLEQGRLEEEKPCSACNLCASIP